VPHHTGKGGKALFRIAVVWNVPVACNRASADFIISSPLMSAGYEHLISDYSKYRAHLAVGTHSKPATEVAAESLRQRHSLGVHEMTRRRKSDEHRPALDSSSDRAKEHAQRFL
jgi:hypothetical protein